MIKNNIFWSFVFFFVVACAIAQETRSQSVSNHLFSLPGNEIIVDYLPGNDIIYIHVMDSGTTVYSLARFFQVPLDKVMKINHLHSGSTINLGQTVHIPIPKERITTQYSKKSLKVYYNVKKRETLYTISRVFNTDLPTLLKINNKTTHQIGEGEKILVGYLTMEAYFSGQAKTDTLSTESDDIITMYYLNDVIGYWDKTRTGFQLFVLHNEARIGSFMDIYNPMLQRHTKAKVIGRIPPGTYFSDIGIILSPQCAKILGILDSRFKVNIKYEK